MIARVPSRMTQREQGGGVVEGRKVFRPAMTWRHNWNRISQGQHLNSRTVNSVGAVFIILHQAPVLAYKPLPAQLATRKELEEI